MKNTEARGWQNLNAETLTKHHLILAKPPPPPELQRIVYGSVGRRRDLRRIRSGAPPIYDFIETKLSFERFRELNLFRNK